MGIISNLAYPLTEVMEAVHALRDEGMGAWFTIDAGPQVKVICSADDAAVIAERLGTLDGVQDVITAAPGVGARVLEDDA